MAKVRTRPETETLYLDFFNQGVHCREQTALPDSAENRRLQRAGVDVIFGRSFDPSVRDAFA